MTFSILARDRATGTLGGAATTGSLCVGGWVLRGDSRWGLSASQGAAPSPMWGEDVIEAMRMGRDAAAAVDEVTQADSGRAWRQLAALDPGGGTGVFTGAHNTGWHGHAAGADVIVAGNMLSGPEVVTATLAAFQEARGTMAERLIAALAAGEAAGGDSRGLQSAALLVLASDAPPLTLRIDWAEAPIAALAALYARTQQGEYADWLPCVPTRDDPERHPG
ncbi:DUF1028 domain-containing protein [Aquicoccus porphyridii]|uniref:DUF1028 domain-containing protein n=1 Tax=Aquicoccus porphyridii TaxID=1852029 RepID=A0A5A9ZVA6_9RHOB|nr:DUF1028 domain-containing protein [Aquicoccus porphyridii]KAA0921119.1 DUF1028 domain-containing protein [Aquicoccus porphyridii]RAI56346.1 DUF1028 domain-containing protein [Rhodobacteraceae bacterium AsT-22]